MQKLLWIPAVVGIPLALLLSSIGLMGCSLFGQPDSAPPDQGAASLTISLPAEHRSLIATVKLILTRGSQSITKSLQVSNDSAVAAGCVSGLSPGEWQVTVQMLDAKGNVLYQGATTVVVKAGATTPIAVSVEPVSGYISISTDATIWDGEFGLSVGNYWRWHYSHRWGNEVSYEGDQSWFTNGIGSLEGNPALCIRLTVENEYETLTLDTCLYRTGEEGDYDYYLTPLAFGIEVIDISETSSLVFTSPVKIGDTMLGGLRVVDRRTISVPAGTFEVWYMERTIEDSHESDFGDTYTSRTTYRGWVSPTVGIVKIECLDQFTTTGGETWETDYSTVMELVQFDQRDVPSDATTQSAGDDRDISWQEFLFGPGRSTPRKW